jgi:uncharacterized secreted protein with C-terminal beta-propeller domain
MVQKEVKHKTKLYTVAAVLLALVLVSSIYVATMPTPATFGMYGLTGISSMKTFASTDELKNYLLTNTQSDTGHFTDRGGDGISPPVPVPDVVYGDSAPSRRSTSGTSEASSPGGYSSTNVQVAGVDEADVVKTDGKYIYTLINTDTIYPSIQIITADSKKPSIVGKIEFDNLHFPDGIYLSENGHKLTVLGKHYNNGGVVESFIYVYDVSNRAKPTLTRAVTFSGYYFSSRMIGDYVYAVISQPAYVADKKVILPQISLDTVTQEIGPTCIYYTEMKDSSFSYNTFIGFNLIDDTEQPTSMTILMGASSCMYVSTNNMYVTFPDTDGNTEIYRMAINDVHITFEAQGIVPGYVLNQYSMDEYNSYFRIATTIPTSWGDNSEGHNNLYVLDMNLDEVGKVENLAKGERIYVTRFAGNKAYLVTFKQVDPFFVLDLKDPTAPKVAGELKIPGFSSYLHPYNENYIMGIGLEENRFVKLSLFDVTNMNNPTEIAKYIIGEYPASSSSSALYNPKTFLFNPQKHLLVIPISGGPLSGASFWSGVYIFKVSPENGFILQNEIAHSQTFQTPHDNAQHTFHPQINTAIYIGNTLYTISDYQIQLHNLDNYNLIAQINF